MAELEADEISEEKLNRAVYFASEQNQKLARFFKQIAESLGINKKSKKDISELKDFADNSQEKQLTKDLKQFLDAKESWLAKEKKIEKYLQELKLKDENAKLEKL